MTLRRRVCGPGDPLYEFEDAIVGGPEPFGAVADEIWRLLVERRGAAPDG